MNPMNPQVENPGRRRVTVREVLAAAAGRWSEIYSRLAPQFREAIEYAGGSRHVDCPVKPGNNGDGFRMFPDWQQTGGCVCNSCGTYPTGLTALIWVNAWNHDYAVEQIAAVLGMDQPKRRGRPAKVKPVNQIPPSMNGLTGHAKDHANGHAKPNANHAQQLEISRRRAKIADRWQSSIPDKGTIAAYLAFRCLSIPVPPSLKLAESLPYFAADQTAIGNFPAIIAQVMHPTLGLVALHRTYLSADQATAPGKAPLPDGCSAKKLTPPIYDGATTGAAIRLFPATTTVALAEGIETALAIHQATGTPAWSTVSAGGLSSIELPKEIATVEIWADPGDVGQQAAKQAAERLAAEHRTVFVIAPPPEHAAENHDWLDILVADGSEALTAAREAAVEFHRPTGEVVDIYLRTTEHEVTDEVVNAIANDPTIFCRGGQLVHVISDASRSRPGILRPSIAPRIAIIPEPRLRERITACCRLLSKDKDGEYKAQHPPTWVVKETASRCNWPAVRHLEAIVETPILRHDGSIFATPGYDFISGVYYEPDISTIGDGSGIPPIPANPTTEQIQLATATILEVVRDFPFATPAHQSAWLAAVLTPFARFAFRGPAPLFLIDANVRGAGKSLLCDLVGLIVSGREMARMVNSRADEEMRKRITAIAIAGDPLVLIDNIVDSLGGAGLDAALTSSTWTDRILGKSENTVPMPLCATWYATGNNVVLKSDIARRVCHVRLESPEENPEERTTFVHENIRGHVYKNRPKLIAAALTILRGYTAALTAGHPKPKFAPWGSFEGWSNLIRGSIIHAGLADPGETREQVREESDSEGQSLRSFMAAWEKLDPDNLGMTISDGIKKIAELFEIKSQSAPEINLAFIEFSNSKDNKSISSRSLGMRMHHIKGRYLNGKCFARKTTENHFTVWTIKHPSGTKESTGTNSYLESFGAINTDDICHSNYAQNNKGLELLPVESVVPGNGFVEEIL